MSNGKIKSWVSGVRFQGFFPVFKLVFYDLKGETYFADLEKWFKTKALYVFICNIICIYNIIYNAYYHYEYSIIYNIHNIIHTYIWYTLCI